MKLLRCLAWYWKQKAHSAGGISGLVIIVPALATVLVLEKREPDPTVTPLSFAGASPGGAAALRSPLLSLSRSRKFSMSAGIPVRTNVSGKANLSPSFRPFLLPCFPFRSREVEELTIQSLLVATLFLRRLASDDELRRHNRVGPSLPGEALRPALFTHCFGGNR